MSSSTETRLGRRLLATAGEKGSDMDGHGAHADAHIEMQHAQHRIRFTNSGVSHDDLYQGRSPISDESLLPCLEERLALNRLDSRLIRRFIVDADTEVC